jgi:endo-1,4-beta-xylanase
MRLKFSSTIMLAALLSAFYFGCSNDQPTSPIQQESSLNKSSNGKQVSSTGTDHGFFWQNYVSGGSSTITFPGAGTYPGNFAVNYTNVGDVVAGKGWNPGAVRNIGYNVGSISGSFNNFSVYGWTTNPLIEYYVCEFGSVATGSAIGSFSSDGHNYTVYKHQQVNQPSIIGTATFWQYLSQWGGSSTGTNHTVSMANHFNYWKSHIGSMGAFNLQILAIEAFGNKSGSCNATVWAQ